METDIERIWQDLEWIAAEPRYAETDRLEECRQYCERELRAAGWTVTRRSFTAVSEATTTSLNGINLVCTRGTPGGNRPKFVLGAHLDSREETPGADDNASAVAVLLEVARIAGAKLSEVNSADLPTELELAVFDLEEHGMLGGAFHAETCRAEGDPLCGMVSLEMLGYCSNEPGSQHFPDALAGMYPDVGNFIGIVGNQISGRLIDHFRGAFQDVQDLPAEALQVPENGLQFPACRLSDHSPFWDAGFAALMITDTSYMRNPHYHMPTDTPDTLDRNFLHKVAEGVLHAVQRIVLHGLS